MVFQMIAQGIFQEDHWYIGHIDFITAFGYPILQSLGRKQKVIILPKSSKDPKFPQNVCLLASCLQQASYSRKLF
jgi:hypothetical protein